MPYTVPGLDADDAKQIAQTLQERLTSLIDLQLTLKHVHWNVVGPNFIAVHELLDEHVEAVRGMTDAVAERIATLGHVPEGTPGAVVRSRTWDDYGLGRATAQEHLAALDLVYAGVIVDHRRAITAFDELDLVSQGLLIGQAEKLELHHWFVRAHLADASGGLPTADATHLREAAEAARAGGA